MFWQLWTATVTAKWFISAASLQVPAVQELHTEDMVQWGQQQVECE